VTAPARLTTSALIAALTVMSAAAAAAFAAPCGKPDLLDMIPPDQATGVPPNATLAAIYQRSAEYVNEQVVVKTPDGTEQALPASFDSTEGRLSVTPPDLLPPGEYTVTWPVLRALASATPGLGGQTTFVVGTTFDAEPPAFEGVLGVRWDYEREADDCTDEITQRYVFDVDIGVASDDGGRDGLTLILFQTRGPAADGGSVPVYARALPDRDGATVRVALVPADVIGEVCFAGLVRDTTGKISNSADREVCVKTVAPPFFRGCSVAPGGGADSAACVPALALLIAVCRRRRSRSRP